MRFRPKCKFRALSDDSGVEKYEQRLYVTGNQKTLGAWSEGSSLRMALMPGSEDVWELETEVEVENGCAYKYLVKRAGMLVKWETIPPPYRSWKEVESSEVSLCCEAAAHESEYHFANSSLTLGSLLCAGYS